MLERDLEKKLAQRVKAAGGMAIKWVAPNLAGVPDRICFFKGGRVVLVELKRPGAKPTPLQKRIHDLLIGLGADVRVVDSVEKIEELIG
jgi:hypothetical protein